MLGVKSTKLPVSCRLEIPPVFSSFTAYDAAERSILHASCTWGFRLAYAVLVGLVLACAVVASASEPDPAGMTGSSGYEAEAVGAGGEEINAGIGPGGLIAAWLGVLAAV